MSVLAQGTKIYFIDPNGGTPQIVEVEKATSFNPGGAPATQIDETTLADLVYMQYRAGLRDPGQATIGVNSDPSIASHVTLHGLSEMSPSPKVTWAIGWSDGTDAPTLDVDDTFILPATRTWFTFDGYVSDFPFNHDANTIITTEVTIQRSGGSTWTPKTA